ncbi:MAG TPA: ABC transporter permease [Woeseiaceae bacterium]|nr:ABC transporter permease [Woeseiaceae bacterium]
MNSGLLAGLAIESRRAARGLVRTPGFSVGVVLVLGIATAGMVTVATAAYALFLRPLPYAHPEELAQVSIYSRTIDMDMGFSPPLLAELRELPMVADVAASHLAAPVESAGGDVWQRAMVTRNLMQVLAVSPVAGRAFVPANGEPGAAPVVLISEAAWRNRFDAAESVIGSELALDDRTVTVIGVMPATFTVPSPATEMWEPLRYTPEQLGPQNVGDFGGGRGVLVRLEPGYAAPQLEQAIAARYASDARLNSRALQQMLGLDFRARSLRDAWTAEQRQPLAIIGLASVLVLAAALFNVAGLWLTRLLGRSREQAIQAALGAGKWRRLGRTLIEFALLGVVGGCVALALAPLMLACLQKLGIASLDQPLRIETGTATVVITIIVLVLAGLPVILAAAWQQRRQGGAVAAGLGSAGRGDVSSSARTRRVLVTAQVALAMSVLCAMGLLLRSWHSLLTEDLGFEARNLLIALIQPPEGWDGETHADPRVAAALDELRQLPGVSGVARTNVVPFGFTESAMSVGLPGQGDSEVSVRNRMVGEHFFRTIGIPLLRGRSFEAGDAGTGGVIVDELFASLYWPAGGALGKRITMTAGPDAVRDALIIGIVGTAKYRSPDEQPDRGTVYQFDPRSLPYGTAVIAANVSPATLVEEVTRALEATLGPERIGRVVTMQSLVRHAVSDREPQLILLGLFGIETLMLAVIGLFSLLAYSVRARTAEFGVRQAVGAEARDIRRHVLADAVRLLVPGLAIGIAGACIAGYVIANRLYEVSPVDPVTWVAIGMILVLVVLAAALWPAERAARIEPTEALRHE